MKNFLLVLGLVFVLGASVYANTDEFMAAAKSGDADIVKEYLGYGMNVNLKDEGTRGGGRTALIHAAMAGHANVIEVLIDGGADVSLMDNSGNTALLVASEKGYSEVVELLIKGGADVNQQVHKTVVFVKQIRTPMVKAFENKHFKVLELLLAAGADINVRDEKGRTILMKASESGDAEMVEFIMKYKPDLTLRDNSRKTAEDVAKNIEILRLLKSSNV